MDCDVAGVVKLEVEWVMSNVVVLLGSFGSLVTSACVVCGASNPVITTMERLAYAGCLSICEKRR